LRQPPSDYADGMEVLRLFQPTRARVDAEAGLECLLRENRPLRLARARGKRIRCTDGCAWITAPGMLADVFLLSGETWELDTDGLVLIEAVGSAAILIGDSAQPTSPST
jgi:hypothetical protein